MEVVTFGDDPSQTLALLTSPLFLGALLGLLIFAALLAIAPRLKWVAMTLLLFLVTVSYSVDLAMNAAIAPPLSQIRTIARPACMGILALLLLPGVMSSRGWRVRLTSFAALLWLLFHVLLAFQAGLRGQHFRAFIGGVTDVLIFATLGLILPRWLQTLDDVRALVRSIAWSSILMLLATVYQLALNPSGVVSGGRLTGLGGNPIGLATIFALSMPAFFYLVVRVGASTFSRFFYGLMIGLSTAAIAWSGSRGPFLALGLVTLSFFRAKIGRLLMVGIVGLVFVALMAKIFSDSGQSIDRLFSLTDSRTQVLAASLEVFFKHPIAGDLESSSLPENSYVATAERTGLIGLFLMIPFVAIAIREVALGRRKTPGMPTDNALRDIPLAGAWGLFVVTMTAAYFMATLAHQVFMMYAYLAMSRFWYDRASAIEVTGQDPTAAEVYMSPSDSPEWADGYALDDFGEPMSLAGAATSREGY